VNIAEDDTATFRYESYDANLAALTDKFGFIFGEVEVDAVNVW
jgi:hypothetical protein